jgi:hypothetical protein
MNFEETNIIIDVNDIEINNKKSNNDEYLLTNVTKEENTNTLKDDAFKKLKQNHVSKQLLMSRQTTPSCGLIIIDNFYNNALDTRNYMLTQDFSVKGNYPGNRTRSYANEHLKKIIQKYVEPFAGKITKFPIPKPDLSDANTIYNGAFQYTTSRDRSWVHTDGWNNWAGVLFLTPDAPLSSGTGFFRFQDGTRSEQDNKLLNNKKTTDTYSQDLTKWELVDRVGNVFNRLILFNSYNYHMSMDYFGDSKENGRLFQVFFFSTENELI